MKMMYWKHKTHTDWMDSPAASDHD